MSGVASGRAVIDAWNGFAAGAHELWSILAGGHTDGWQNKTYLLDLSQPAPRWRKVHDGSRLENVINNAPYYADGLPGARHNYYGALVNETDRKVMHFCATGYWTARGSGVNPGVGAQVDAYDIATNTWAPMGTYASCPLRPQYIAVARDPRSDDVYVAEQGGVGRLRVAKWARHSQQWSQLQVRNSEVSGGWEFRPSMVDAKRNRLVSVNRGRGGPASGSSLETIDLARNELASISITGALAGVLDYAGLTHDGDNDRYLLAMGGNDFADIYAIDPETGSSTLLSSRIAGPADGTGINTRFAYFSELGGVAYQPSFATELMFLPTRSDA